MSIAMYGSLPRLAETDTDDVERTMAAVKIVKVTVVTATTYDLHHHDADQLSWMRSGRMRISVGGACWDLGRDSLVWVPADVPHQMTVPVPGDLISVYADPRLRPEGARWDRPIVLDADPLSTRLLDHLVVAARSAQRRHRCHTLLVDLLAEAAESHVVGVLPEDVRARAIAEALMQNPADTRTLAAWAEHLAVSEKTLARAFVAETGLNFRQWRVQCRLQAAAALLTSGLAVADAAERVGYSSSSGFIAAFGEAFGVTPGQYGLTSATALSPQTPASRPS